MPPLRIFVARLLAMMQRRHLDGVLDEEIRSHLEQLERDHCARGLSPQAAREAARRDFGTVAAMKEDYRNQRRLSWADVLWQDTRDAVRSLVRFPAVNLVAILTLAISIGANAAMFSVVYHVLLQPLPYANPERIVFLARVSDDAPGAGRWFSLGRVEAFREAASFAGVGAYLANRVEDVTLSGSGTPEVLRGTRISSNFLDVLGVRPRIGRAFLAEEDAPGSAAVALISAELWRRRFASDPSIAGRTVVLDATPHTIVGVLPPAFHFPLRNLDVWLPQPAETSALPAQYRRCCTPLLGFARLRSGVT